MTAGQIGAVPHWYRVIRAARYLKVAPWDLAGASAFWLHAAEEAQGAEAEAETRRRKSKFFGSKS